MSEAKRKAVVVRRWQRLYVDNFPLLQSGDETSDAFFKVMAAFGIEVCGDPFANALESTVHISARVRPLAENSEDLWKIVKDLDGCKPFTDFPQRLRARLAPPPRKTPARGDGESGKGNKKRKFKKGVACASLFVSNFDWRVGKTKQSFEKIFAAFGEATAIISTDRFDAPYATVYFTNVRDAVRAMRASPFQYCGETLDVRFASKKPVSKGKGKQRSRKGAPKGGGGGGGVF